MTVSYTSPHTENRLSSGTSKIFLIAAVLFLVATLVLGPTPFVDRIAAATIIGYCLVMAAILRSAPRELMPHVLVIGWFGVIFFLPRLFSFAAFPPNTVNFVAISPLTPNEITRGMLFVTAGTLALVVGLWLGNLPFRGRSDPTARDTARPILPIVPILVFWLIAFAAAYYVSVMLQVSIFGTPDKWGSRSGWLARVFDTDAALLLLLVWGTVSMAAGRRDLWLIVGLAIIWLLFSIYMGSRGGPLRILFVFGLATIAVMQDPRVSFGRLLAILVFAFACNALVYPIATMVRYHIGGVENAAAQVKSDWQRETRSVNFDQAQMTTVQRVVWKNAQVQRAAGLLAPLTTRLGVIDYPLIVVNREPAQDVIDHYLTMDYALKNYANNMVPGELFPDHDIMTSRVFTMAYRGAPESHIRTAFLSEPWTSWGFAWIKGGAIGGLAVLVLLAGLSQFGYSAINAFLPAAVAPYYAAAWLFVVAGNGPVQLFGIDHWLTVASHFCIALTVALLLVLAMAHVARRIGFRSRALVIGR